MGKSVKSGHYQKITQKWSWMEGLPSAMFLQKSCWWKGFQGRHIYRNGCGWKGFQAWHIYRKVVDGKASKHDIFTERGQGGIGCPLTSTPPPPFKGVTSRHCWGWRGVEWVEWDGIKVTGSNVVSCSRVCLMEVCYMFWSMDVILGLL